MILPTGTFGYIGLILMSASVMGSLYCVVKGSFDIWRIGRA